MATIPDKNSVLQQPYLLLNIDELENPIHSPNKSISNCFAIINLQSPPQSNTFIQVDKRTFENLIK